MTRTEENITLSRDQLRDILVAARDNLPVEENDLEVYDYDWKRPHQFNDVHHAILLQFRKQFSADLAELFSEMCNDPSRVTIPQAREYYCEGIRKEFCDQKKNLYMVLADENNIEVGALILPYLSAIQWTAKMLGDTDPEVSEDYEMSNLEESLLVDFCDNLLRKFSDMLVKQELGGIRSLSVLSDRDWPIECLDYEEFTLLQLQVEHTGGSSEASLVIMSSYLGPMLDITFPDESQSNNRQARDAVISNLNKIPIEIDVLLGNANVAVSNLMNLVKGDVVVLDRKVNEPVEALIEGKVFFRGYPARSSNRYALAVSGMVAPDDDKINTN